MVDIILMPEGEAVQAFDLGIGLDREHPMQTALGMVTPVPLVPTDKGPPHVGDTGWLFHLDAPNLVLTGMRPGGLERRDAEPLPDLTDAVTARLLECTGYHSSAEFRCVRDPLRAALLDARGTRLMDASVSGDAVLFDVAPGDLMQVQVEFSEAASNPQPALSGSG
jgi:alpha-mannosidase